MPSKRYFASPFDVDNERARDAGKVLACRTGNNEALCAVRHGAYRRFLSATQFQYGFAVFRETFAKLPDDRPVCGKAVSPAFERKPRIMVPHFRRQ
jgi:hypothetical protein